MGRLEQADIGFLLVLPSSLCPVPSPSQGMVPVLSAGELRGFKQILKKLPYL